jgi:hypothetical protein
MRRGYIPLWRKCVDNRLYFAEPFDKFHAWIDLLLMANHKENRTYVRGIQVDIKRGQVLASEDFLADRWRWSRGKVRRFLDALSSKKPNEIDDQNLVECSQGKTVQQTVQQIVQHKNNVCTLLTILNYESYQLNGQTNGTAGGTASSTADGQQTDTPNNVKNEKESLTPDKPVEKKKRKTFIPPTSDEVRAYALTAGCEWLDADEFVNFYASTNWYRGKTKISDWKACMRTWKRKRFDGPRQREQTVGGILV